MSVAPLLLLHGIRGSRLAIRGPAGPEIIWELANESHPRAHLLGLHHDAAGKHEAADPAQPVFPLDLEPGTYGAFLDWAAARGPLTASAWDWRLAPGEAAAGLAALVPGEALDIVTHSMGLHLLGWLVLEGHLPLERVRRLALLAPAFGGALDILHVLLSGSDRAADEGDATGRAYGHVVRSLPSLYRLLPVPGHGLLVDGGGRELDPLELAGWPADALGEGERHRGTLALLLEGARRDRERLARFTRLLPDLGDRLLILAGRGVETPVRCRMEGRGMSCAASRLHFSREGDGRLAVAAQRPADLELPCELFGRPGEPVSHGEILRHPQVLARLASFLDS
jgi:hypothetical protein